MFFFIIIVTLYRCRRCPAKTTLRDERPNNNKSYYSFEVQSCPHRLRFAPSHGQVFPTADFPDPLPLDKRVSPGVFTYPIITGEIWLSTRCWKSVPWIFAIKRTERKSSVQSQTLQCKVQILLYDRRTVLWSIQWNQTNHKWKCSFKGECNKCN